MSRVFSNDCKFVNEFQVPNGVKDIATDRNNNLVVWDQNKVTWHSCPDGKPLKQMTLSDELKHFSHLKINSAEQLIFYK